MRLPQIKAAVLDRLRHPAYWAAGMGILLFPMGFILLTSPNPNQVRFILHGLLLVCFWTPALFLSPAPWQWTGNDRPLTGWLRGLLQAILLTVLLSAPLAALHYLVLFLLHHLSHGDMGTYSAFWSGNVFWSFLLYIPAGLTIARMERLILEARAAKTRAREAQWMSHRGAFSPRLLFSHLEHLADGALADAHATEQGLVDLAALYRQWLVEAEKPLVPLSTERALSEQYLALERPKWGERLRFRWHLEPDLDAALVPSLLLLPFLEAALASGPEAGFVVLDIKVRPGLELTLQIQTPAPPPMDEVLNSLRQRIRALSSREQVVQMQVLETGWEVLLRLPSWQDGDRS